MPAWLQKIYKLQKPEYWLIEGAATVAAVGYLLYKKAHANTATSGANPATGNTLPAGVTPANLAGIPYAYSDPTQGSVSSDTSGYATSGGYAYSPTSGAYGTPAPAPAPIPVSTPGAPAPLPTTPAPPVSTPTQTPVSAPVFNGTSGAQGVFPDPKGTQGESNNFWVYGSKPYDTLSSINAMAGWSQFGPSYLYNYRNNAAIFRSLGLTPTDSNIALPVGTEVSV
jgi:hypothetical protein